MARPMLKLVMPALIVFGLFVAAAILVDRLSDLREARIESRFPPIGAMVQIDGRNVHVIVKGSGPDLVLIHGAGGNARDFTFRLMDELTDRYRVYAVDRPGLGWSDPIGRAATPLEQARHLARATRELGADYPIVLGHSYGGAVAMGWALEEPAAGIVIVSGATMPWPGPLRSYYRVFGSWLGGLIGAPLVSAFVTEAQIEASVDGVFEPAPTPDNYINAAAIPLATRQESFRESAAQVKTLRPQVVDMSERYGGVDLPVEILHGTEDTVVRPEIHAVPLSQVLPEAVLTLMEGVGHAPHNVDPDTVARAIDRAAARAGLR